MTDLATLGLRIDSSPIDAGKQSLDQFSDSARKAETATGQAQKATEQLGQEMDRMSRSSMTWATTIGSIIGNFASSAFRAGLSAIEDYVSGLKKLEEAARLTETSLAGVLSTAVSAKAKGLSFDDTAKMLTGIGEQLDKASYTKGTDIEKLFKANGIAIRDAKGDMIGLDEATYKLADLVANAASEFQKIKIAEMGGAAREAVPYLEQGGDALRRMAENSASSREEMRRIIDLAGEFDRVWREASTAIKNYLLGAFDEVREYISMFLKSTATDISNLFKIGKMIGLTERSGTEEGSMAGFLNKLGDIIGKQGERPITVSKPFRRTGTTIIPTGDGGKEPADKKDDFDSMTKRIEDQTRRLEEQATTFGKSAGEIARYRAEQELLTAAQRAEREMTPELRSQIDQLAEKYAKAAETMEQLRQKSQQMREMQQFFGNELVDVLDRATERGADLSKIFDDVAAAIKRAVIQAMILGQGPLAGLFGTAAPAGSNSMGGIFGWAANGMKGWFGGGGAYDPSGGGWANFDPGYAHTGGVIGQSALTRHWVHPAYFDDAPRYHTGGIIGLGPDEFPIIGKSGEEVLTRDDPRHRYNGGGSTASQPMQVVINNNHSGANVTAREAPDGSGGRRMEVQIDEMVAGAVGRGRMTGSALRNYGMRQSVLQA